MKGLHSRIFLTITLAALICVAIICIFTNVFLDKGLEDIAKKEQATKINDITANLAMLYDPAGSTWDTDAIHALGMYSLTDGYIIKLTDAAEQTVWDAQNHDMARCADIMGDIENRMRDHGIIGAFESKDLPVEQKGKQIGTVAITSYGPYFLTEATLTYKQSLGRILIIAIVISLAFAFLVGRRLATRIERDRHMREKLTADVAHELRTPLAALSIQLESMSDGVLEPTPERLADCYAELARLTGLVENLGRIEQADAMAALTEALSNARQ
jgi:hypothetical protein